MLQTLRAKTGRLKRHLTTLDGQPLGKAALVVIVFLDIFILVSLFDGLESHTRQLMAPAEYVPPYCRDMVLEAKWNETARFGNLVRIASAYRDSYYLPPAEDHDARHPTCAPFGRALEAIKTDEALSKRVTEVVRLEREAATARAELDRLKGAYDTALLESIAGREGAQSASLRREIATKTAVLDNVARRHGVLRGAIEQDERVQRLYGSIAAITDTVRDDLREDLRRLNFWYPVKRLGMELLFLLPLFLAFYVWNAKSLKANRPFQVLVSSHLLIIVLVPAFLKVFELVYDIIPKRLLKRIIELLESLNLVALWHYLVMAAAIVAALALIFFLQRKLFSRDKLIEKRIARGLCQDCGQRLPEGSRACPACGFVQYVACPSCGGSRHAGGKYCRECGAPRPTLSPP